MKVKEEESTEGGRRRSGRLAKARVAKKNTNEDGDQQTPSLANSSQSNTPMASPNIMSPSTDLIINGENANHQNHCSPAVTLQSSSSKPTPSLLTSTIAIAKETEPTPPFTRIDENVYLFDRKRSRNHKDKMVCDCILTKEERQRGLTGCGEDCLNRILMMECGSRCPVGNDCANKRFQKKQYVKCEPFRAGKKGWGLRVLERVDPGTFIMEYVGEVVNPSEFKSRVRKCAKEKKEHHYFMALKSDEIIDATVKGNMTRFVNHSCEPTCETQKWTVNGDLRVGFFAIKTLEPGNEVTFNYQFERYGKKAQPCYCETPSCQGVIGGTGTSKIAIDGTRFTAEELEDIKEYDEILEQDKDAFEDLALGAEIEKLCEVGFLKNKRQVMTLARIMLRTEDNEDRMKLLNVLDETKESVFRRLFIDYHGLRLLWSWMVDTDNIFVKAGILQVLSVLPIPNKTVLMESKVLEVVERWSSEPEPVAVAVLPTLIPSNEVKSTVTNDEMEPKISIAEPDLSVPKDIVAETETGLLHNTIIVPKTEAVSDDVPVVDDFGGFQEETSTPVVERAKIKITIISKKDEKKDDLTKSETNDLPTPPNIAVLSRKLLHMWKNLKEAYKIPRLVHKNRKDDEMAADALEEAEKTATCDVASVQDRKTSSDLKPNPYDWMLAPLRSKAGDRGSDYNYQVNGQGIEGPIVEDAPKESKVAHRMNFEMELLKEKYERDMEALRIEAEETKRKLQMMEVQQSSLLYPIQEPNLLNQFEQGMFLPSSITESAIPYSVDVMEPSYIQLPEYDPSLIVEDCHPNLTDSVYQEEWPRITVDNLANVVIECTPRNLHSLGSDTEALVCVDYGVEYVPRKKKKVINGQDLFDSSFPAPGMYFDFGDGVSLYTSCIEMKDGSREYVSCPASNVNFDRSEDEDVSGPLPRHWRRARDEASGRPFYFNKKKSESMWKIPGGTKAVDHTNFLDREPKPKSESIVATADSTSCVGTATATNSPATSSCMNSPLGIFYKAPINGSKGDPRIKATPDQSSHKKFGKRKKPNLEKFKSEVSEMVKKFLYPYQKDDCRIGKIVSPGDFKHLCKKFTNEIYAKEVKTGKTDLVVNDVVKKKSKGYVKKYMATRGPVFRLGNSPAQEDDNPVSSLTTNDEEAIAEDDGQVEGFKEGSVS